MVYIAVSKTVAERIEGSSPSLGTMKKQEANFTAKFSHWVRVNFKRLQSGPYELKSSRGKDSIPFSAVEEHQLAALSACTTDKGFWYKISDQSQGYKPFDAIFFRNAPAYLVFEFPKSFHIIPVRGFLEEVKNSKRKSLTEARAKEISIISSK